MLTCVNRALTDTVVTNDACIFPKCLKTAAIVVGKVRNFVALFTGSVGSAFVTVARKIVCG